MQSATLSRRRFTALFGAAGLACAAPSILRAAPATETMAGRAFATGWRVTVPSGRDLASLRAAIDAGKSPRSASGVAMTTSPNSRPSANSVDAIDSSSVVRTKTLIETAGVIAMSIVCSDSLWIS
jgi:hypothetical protein